MEGRPAQIFVVQNDVKRFKRDSRQSISSSPWVLCPLIAGK